MSRKSRQGVLIFGMLGVFFATLTYAGQNLSVGSAAHMGAGYFPRMVAFICAGLSLLVLGRAVREQFALGGSGQTASAEDQSPIDWRGLASITLGVVVFAALIRPAGLIPATLGVVLVCTAAQVYRGWMERLTLAGGLAAGAGLIFVEGLGLPFQLFPSF